MVIDASVAFKLVVQEPDSEAAIAWIGREELVAPALVHSEVGNALWKRVRKGELAADDEIDDRLADLGRYLRTIDETPLIPTALRLAVEIGHPIYDCIYLAVAQKLDAQLLTADQRFLRAVVGTRHAGRVKGMRDG
jgi:predicted nucleic acid-binding protein